MVFHQLSLDKWKRKKEFELYYQNIPCTYSMVCNVEITNLYSVVKEHCLKFFPTVLYGISKLVNNHREFRMDVDENFNIGYYDALNPCLTFFHEKEECFTNIWSEYSDKYDIFMNNYSSDIKKYQNITDESKPLNDNKVFCVSCIPWVSFCGFNLNLQKGYDYFLPIFTIGKYFFDREKKMLPIAIQVHHAVCDGYHVSVFVNELQAWADTFCPERIK